MNFIDFDLSENIIKKYIIEKIKTSIISHKENEKNNTYRRMDKFNKNKC